MAIYTSLNHKGNTVSMYEWVSGYADDREENQREVEELYRDETWRFARRWIFEVITVITTEIMVSCVPFLHPLHS